MGPTRTPLQIQLTLQTYIVFILAAKAREVYKRMRFCLLLDKYTRGGFGKHNLGYRQVKIPKRGNS